MSRGASTIQVDHLRAVFARNAARPLFIDEASGEERSYGAFMRDSLRLAAALQRMHVGPGDCVAFSAGNSMALATLYFAAWHCGAEVVPVNPQLHDSDIAQILADCHPRLAFVEPAVLERLRASGVPGLPRLMRCFADGATGLRDSWKQLVDFDVAAAIDSAPEPLERPFGHADDDTVFLRIYTSGSTSRPKAIAIAYGPLVGNERLFCQTLGIGPENRFYNILPMAYLGGVHNLMLLPIAAESSIVMGAPLGGSRLYGFWETVRERGINTLWFTSAMLNMLMSLRQDEDLAFLRQQMRIGLVGMAPLSPSVKANFEERFGFALHENYALSETLFLTTGLPSLPYRPGSCGPVLPGVELEIVDEHGAVLPAGEIGEIRVRTPYMMKGYVNMKPEEARTLTPQGFLTGDLGYLDEGELFSTGRVKDLIIRGGLNISPAAVEEAIYKHPAVELAVVVGIPHEIYGEEVAALVTLKAWAQGKVEPGEILRQSEKHLAAFQRPKTLDIVDTMPLGATGKVDKRRIRELLSTPARPVDRPAASESQSTMATR
jgi:long-chain acyl-CoA synthetase